MKSAHEYIGFKRFDNEVASESGRAIAEADAVALSDSIDLQ